MGCCGSSSDSPLVGSSTAKAGKAKQFQVKLFGPPTVGKTSIIYRAMKQDFQKYPQLDSETQHLVCKTPKGEVTLVLIDTAGQEKFRKNTVSEYYGAQATIHVFSLNDPETFEELLKILHETVRFTADLPEDIPIFVIGNKMDLPRNIEKKEAEQKISEISPNGVGYYETSCVEGDSVMKACIDIAEAMLENQS